jgi:hypothetical protein
MHKKYCDKKENFVDNKNSRRIPQFDFIKGIAIISVILLHAGIGLKYFSPYWIGLSVPLFICVSCILNCLVLSRGRGGIKNYFNLDKFKKMFIRIFVPFIMAQIVLIILYMTSGIFSIKGFIGGGGIGLGSYYPWVHLQLWFLMPFMFFLVKKNFIVGSLVIILVSIIVNIIFSIFSSADWFQLPSFINHKKEAFISLYRLCVNRYLFIYPLIFLLVEKRIKYSVLLFCGFISAGFMFLISYKDINLEPIIFNSGWQIFEFPSAFYTVIVFIFLYKIYEFIPNSIKTILCKIGEKSWEIFNFQMIYFTFHTYLNINPYLKLIFGLFICIIPIYSYKFMEKPLELK